MVTVFTPTYNRATVISRTFESLQQQKSRDFEWLIVDDGSTDNTEAIVTGFQRHSTFPIRYYKVPHGGKHRAYNAGLKLAIGELFFVVDSDDSLTKDSLSVITSVAGMLRDRDDICGIIALKENKDGAIYGTPMPHEPVINSLKEFLDCCKDGERSFVFKTEIARKYPFPEIEGEYFVTESVVYERLGKDWGFLIINESLTICEYQSDGLSSNIYNLMLANPIGYMIYHCQRIENSKSLIQAIRHTLRYVAFNSISKSRTQWGKYDGEYRWIVNLLTPVGKIGECYYKYRCRQN